MRLDQAVSVPSILSAAAAAAAGPRRVHERSKHGRPSNVFTENVKNGPPLVFRQAH